MFFFFIFPVTLLFLLVTFGGLRLHQMSMRDLVGDRDERLVRAAAQEIADGISARQRALLGLAALLDDSADPQSTLDQAVALLPVFDRGLILFDASGVPLAVHPAVSLELLRESYTSIDLSLPAGLPRPVHWSPPADDQTNLLLFPIRVGADRLLVGALHVGRLIEQTLRNLGSETGAADFFTVDQSLRVLYQSEHAGSQEELATHPGVREALSGNSGSTLFDTGSEEHVVAYSPINPVGWALVIEEPWHVVASPLLRITEFAPLLLVPLLLLALFALWFVASRIVQPLQSLARRTSALAWGDFEAIRHPVGGVGEIRLLQNELVLMADKVKAAQQSLRGYIGAITRGQEDERRRLARELHDDTLQSLIALNQRLLLAEMSASTAAEKDRLSELLRLTDTTIQDLRRVTRALRPVYLEDLGLVTALDMLGKEVSKPGVLDVVINVAGEVCRLPPELELTLYRVAQEALSNVVRHASASHIRLSLTYSHGMVELSIEDDGMGFKILENPASYASQGHFGLLGIHERIDLIHGRLSLDSAPGQGTRLRIVAPIPSKGESPSGED